MYKVEGFYLIQLIKLLTECLHQHVVDLNDIGVIKINRKFTILISDLMAFSSSKLKTSWLNQMLVLI